MDVDLLKYTFLAKYFVNNRAPAHGEDREERGTASLYQFQRQGTGEESGVEMVPPSLPAVAGRGFISQPIYSQLHLDTTQNAVQVKCTLTSANPLPSIIGERKNKD